MLPAENPLCVRGNDFRFAWIEDPSHALWARNGKMIPYDEDLDLLVDGAYWKSPLMMQFLNKTCATYGFVYTWMTGM